MALIANAANQGNIYLYSLDELSREPAVAKQLTSTPGFKRWVQFSPDSKEIFFIESGRIGVVNLEGRARSLAVAAELDVDFSREKMEVFRQGWSYLRDFFYDPGFHGANWEAVRAEYDAGAVRRASRPSGTYNPFASFFKGQKPEESAMPAPEQGEAQPETPGA